MRVGRDCGYQYTGGNTNISAIIMVLDGLSEMMIRCNWRGYKSSSESVLVRKSIDEWPN